MDEDALNIEVRFLSREKPQPSGYLMRRLSLS